MAKTGGERHRFCNGGRGARLLLAIGLLFILSACLRQDRPQAQPGPRAAFGLKGATTGKAPLAVRFTDHSLPGARSIRYREWNFGDGHVSNRPDPVHHYRQPGIYSVSLTVRNELGESRRTREAAVEVLPADVRVTIRAFDTSGRALGKLQAFSEHLRIEKQTPLNDRGLSLRLRPAIDGGMLRIRHPGYIEGLLFINELSETAEYRLVLQHDPLADTRLAAR